MPQSESIYGHSMDPADVPEKISQAIRTLPAEQMYSLMKEMKEVIMVRNLNFKSLETEFEISE